jgi:transcriptional regulator with XRE-family HTH domain
MDDGNRDEPLLGQLEDTAAARHARLVGGNLRDLRRDRGYSQELLAGLVEVDRNHISEWENGRHQPSAHHLDALAAALDCHLTDFYRRRGG